MATITLKNIPDALYERLKQAAKAHHQSINDEVIDCMETVLAPKRYSVTDLLAGARQIRASLTDFKLTEHDLQTARNEGRR